MSHPDLLNGLSQALMAIDFPVYEVDPDTSLHSLTGDTVNASVQLCPETLIFADKQACRIRGRIMEGQQWEVILSFNVPVASHEPLARLAGVPPVIRAVDVIPGQGEESWLAFNWRFLLKRADLTHVPSSSPQGGSKIKLSFDVTHG